MRRSAQMRRTASGWRRPRAEHTRLLSLESGESSGKLRGCTCGCWLSAADGDAELVTNCAAHAAQPAATRQGRRPVAVLSSSVPGSMATKQVAAGAGSYGTVARADMQQRYIS
eukprot:365688-Chlamydomonas_euryale.AAC.19